MTLKISTASRNAACDAIVDLIDGGTGAGEIEIRSGAAPTAPADADSGTLLATLPMSATAFGAASGGVATAASITSDTDADATGTAGHFRVKDGDGTVIMQGSITGTGGGGDLILDNTSIAAGQTVSISSFTVTVPE